MNDKGNSAIIRFIILIVVLLIVVGIIVFVKNGNKKNKNESTPGAQVITVPTINLKTRPKSVKAIP